MIFGIDLMPQHLLKQQLLWALFVFLEHYFITLQAMKELNKKKKKKKRLALSKHIHAYLSVNHGY